MNAETFNINFSNKQSILISQYHLLNKYTKRTYQYINVLHVHSFNSNNLGVIQQEMQCLYLH